MRHNLEMIAVLRAFLARKISSGKSIMGLSEVRDLATRLILLDSNYISAIKLSKKCTEVIVDLEKNYRLYL